MNRGVVVALGFVCLVLQVCVGSVLIVNPEAAAWLRIGALLIVSGAILFILIVYQGCRLNETVERVGKAEALLGRTRAGLQDVLGWPPEKRGHFAVLDLTTRTKLERLSEYIEAFFA